MAEDTLVQMLLEVSGGQVNDEQDIQLARAAGRWAAGQGWGLHLHNSFFVEVQTLSFWILAIRSTQMLEIRVRLEPGRGWHTHAQHQIAHLGHGLDVLAAEDLLPPRFSTIGRRALADFAEALDRGATELWRLAENASPAEIGEYGEAYPREMRIRSATMNRSADQARAFPRAELAVSS